MVLFMIWKNDTKFNLHLTFYAIGSVANISSFRFNKIIVNVYNTNQILYTNIQIFRVSSRYTGTQAYTQTNQILV